MKLGIPVALIAAVAIAVVGCGGSSEEPDSATPSSANDASANESGPGGQSPEDREKLRACLEEQGVELPEGMGQGGPGPAPGSGEGGAPSFGGGAPPDGGGPPGGGEEFREALEKCGVESPPAGQPRPDAGQFRRSITQFVSCMRKNGADLPDPNLSGEAPVFDSNEVDQNDPAFQEAYRKCQDVLRRGGPQDP